MMNWQQTEFLLKGVYLGLLVLVALQGPSWTEVARVGLFLLAGLVLCLGVAAFQKLREGYRVRGRLLGFILFLILENPFLVFTGVILGLTVGAYSIIKENQESIRVFAPVAGGAVLGEIFWLLRRHVRDRKLRLWLGLGLGAVLVGGAIAFFPDLFVGTNQDMAAYLLLLGLPGFYLLTFAGMVEESEIEIAAICAALGVSLWILGTGLSPNPNLKTIALALPIALYFLYTRRILPGLRVFKYVLRGLSYAKVGRYRPALISLGRALQLDPANHLAQETMWRVHQDMDYSQLVNDPETLAVVNFELCLERVAWLLLLDKPRPEQVQEAQRLLDLVESQRPALLPRCRYWQAVAFTHQGQFEKAAAALESVLAEPEKDTPGRRAILLQAWQLALFLHPELKRRVGTPMLAMPGRRMEAIAAVERQLAVKADDQAAWDLKRFLYGELTERDYDSAVLQSPERQRREPAVDFDHEYAHQLGLALIDDKERWRRGCEYLRLAGRGLPAKAPAFFIQMAKAHEKAGAPEEMWNHYRLAMQAARAAGPASLSDEDRHALFAVVKQLGEHALAENDIDQALDSFKFYSQYERAGLDTWRTLAELFERKSQAAADAKEREDALWLALNCIEHALTYEIKEPDVVKQLTALKDRYYYSVTPEQLRQRLENVYKWFDVDYCKNKARWVLDRGAGDLDLLDWASHLAELAQAYDAKSLSARVLRARIARLRGEVEQALALLEEVRNNKPEKFPNSEEEEAWYLAHRLLGELYVDDKPDQAVLCFQEFRKSPKSGANTLYNLGRAYENLGDRTRAMRCYEQVTAFEGNPLVYDARDALDRLRGAGSESFS